MNKFLNQISALVFTLILVPSVLSQSDTITVTHIANAGLRLTDGNRTLYIDFPYKSGAYGYRVYDPAELDSIAPGSTFLFTHRHADHYAKKLVKKYKGTIYGPWKIAKRKGLDVEIMNDPEHQLTIRAIKNKHRFSFKHCSYLLTWHGKIIFISGDAEDPQTIATMQHMDWAFVPEWLLYYAREQNVQIDAEHMGMYHLYPTEKVDDYGEKVTVMQEMHETIYIPY